MAAVRIVDVEVALASDGSVVQVLMTLDGVPGRTEQWRDVTVELARTLAPQQHPVDGVYAVFDASSASRAVLEFGRVLDLEDADQDSLRQLGAGATLAYAVVRRGRGGPKDGEKEHVLAVTIQAAPAEPGQLFGRRLGRRFGRLFGRRRGRQGRGCVIAAVGKDGSVRYVELSRRPGTVGSDAADLAAAYDR
jgi:hypothetical protein